MFFPFCPQIGRLLGIRVRQPTSEWILSISHIFINPAIGPLFASDYRILGLNIWLKNWKEETRAQHLKPNAANGVMKGGNL